MADTDKIKKIPAKKDLLSIIDALQLFEKTRKENNWPDEMQVSKRTFEFWTTKGLFSPPFRGRFNRALYPESVIEDLIVIRVFQVFYGLTIDEIKELCGRLPVCYSELFKSINDPEQQKEFEKILSSNHPNRISRARKLIKQNHPALKGHQEYKDFLKALTAIFKEINETAYYEYLNKTGDELFLIAVDEYEKAENYDIDIIEWSRAQFITTMLEYIADVKRKDFDPETGLKLLIKMKPITYKTCSKIYNNYQKRKILEQAKRQK